MNTNKETKNEVAESRSVKDLLTGPEFMEQVAKAVPRYLTPERLIRVAETTLKRVPALMNTTPESLFRCILDCAAAGLEPDGQHAYLIPYKRECTLIFSYKGLLAMARRNGVSATTKVVFSNDFFEVVEDDGSGCTRVNHRVDFTKARGEMVLVYSRATWTQEGVDHLDYEFMTRDDVEAIRKRSQAGSNGPWKTDFNEMARKTVIRRHAKRWPLSAEAQRSIVADDDVPDFDQERRFAAAKPIFGETEKLTDDLHKEAEKANEEEAA